MATANKTAAQNDAFTAQVKAADTALLQATLANPKKPLPAALKKIIQAELKARAPKEGDAVGLEAFVAAPVKAVRKAPVYKGVLKFTNKGGIEHFMGYRVAYRPDFDTVEEQRQFLKDAGWYCDRIEQALVGDVWKKRWN